MNNSDNQISVPGKRLKTCAVVVPLILVIALGAFTEPLWNWARRALPSSVGVDAVLASDSASGFREGCESAVYRLSPSTVDHLSKEGIAYLSTGARPHNENPRNRYQGWLETPGSIDLANNGRGARETIYGLYGLGGCGSSKGDFHSGAIRAALSNPGSYYTVTANREGIIIVAPQYRLAAYFYVG